MANDPHLLRLSSVDNSAGPLAKTELACAGCDRPWTIYRTINSLCFLSLVVVVVLNLKNDNNEQLVNNKPNWQ